jgi:hypothetical protein|tara:strand:- start:331 stop:621 length:291 start_codon:yes stop_codon:yes gene_type:complete
MEEKVYTKEDGIAAIRDDRGVPNTFGGLFYALLQNADESIVEKFEDHFGPMVASALAVKHILRSSDTDPAKKKEILEGFEKILAKKTSFQEEISDE